MTQQENTIDSLTKRYSAEDSADRSRQVVSFLENLPEGTQRFEVDFATLEKYGLLDIPEGVAVIGGGARVVAEDILNRKEGVVRDIDLAIFGEANPENASDSYYLDELSRKFMPDDYEHGHGVAVVYDLEEYFETRDFTMNQIFLLDGNLVMTDKAHEALTAQKVEFTDFELYRDYSLHPKLVVKALLMEAIFQEKYGHGECVNFPKYYYMKDFFMALALNKAFQYGEDTTKIFIDKCIDHRLAPYWAKSNPVRFARRLAENSDFDFRGIDLCELEMKDWGSFLDDLPEYSEDEQKAIDLAMSSSGFARNEEIYNTFL